MSITQYPEAMNTSEVQIWNNAAFDNCESEDTSTIKASSCSWSSQKPMFVNVSDSLDSGSSKENQSPLFGKSSVPLKSPAPLKPIHPNSLIGNSKLISKQGILENQKEFRNEKKIDTEIEEIEMEISRLSLRLEKLRLEKAEHNVKTVEKRGRVVPAKFMDQKQSVKNSDGVKKIEDQEPMSEIARKKVQRRGFTMGPSEIVAGVRRGVSLGPSEIVAGVKSGQLGKRENITPFQTIQNRRKSCFWKLEEIDEKKVTTQRGRKSSSISPKLNKTSSKITGSRQIATTIGSKKSMKKENVGVSTIQPKKLFLDGEREKSGLANKKPLKPGRVIASRYNQSLVQSTGNSAMRKRSLPENDKEDVKRIDKKRSSSVGKSRLTMQEIGVHQAMENKVKKRWEIPSEVVVMPSLADAEVSDSLPTIRTMRFVNDSPRDSGAAKRVAELVGRKCYFATNCQILSFEEDDEE